MQFTILYFYKWKNLINTIPLYLIILNIPNVKLYLKLLFKFYKYLLFKIIKFFISLYNAKIFMIKNNK